ncbi:MAG: C69 family dipeptidase, partial [Bacteroidales bacterium]|nr:C69 family dipeptidase [Bacteroidales bacterium]
IPDDHVGISANISRIGKIDFNDKDNFLYSSDLKERAQKLGYWDGKGPLVFHKVVGGVKPFSVREYYILNKLAPSLNLSMDADELPFSVKPEMPVTPELMLELFRSTYEGTDLDMTKNLGINVHRKIKTGGIYPNATYDEYDETVYPVSVFMTTDMRTLLNQLKPDVTKRTRTVAVIQCSYAHVIQLRNWLPDAVGGVAYMELDNPAQSPRFPIYCGTEKLPDAFNVCGQHRYREDAAIWAFRETNRIATIDWGKSRKILEPERATLEKQMFMFGKAVETEAEKLIKEGKDDEAAKLLTDYTCNFASMIMGRWKELKAKVLELFIRSM